MRHRVVVPGARVCPHLSAGRRFRSAVFNAPAWRRFNVGIGALSAVAGRSRLGRCAAKRCASAKAEFFSPGQMLRARRAWRRQDLAEKLQMRWELQQRFGYSFPLVLQRPSFRILFLGSSGVPYRCSWQVQEVLTMFQEMCDFPPHFECSAACTDPTMPVQPDHLEDVDLLVCMDEKTKRIVEKTEGCGPHVCLADFLDARPVGEQVDQLYRLICTEWRLQKRHLVAARSMVDLDSESEIHSDLLLTAQAVAVAGLSGFLASLFPEHFKERSSRGPPFAFRLDLGRSVSSGPYQ